MNSKSVHVRRNFLLFVKILFRLLEKTEDELLVEQARLIVFKCRMVYNNYPDHIRQIVHQELRELVGESIWNQTTKLTGYYLCKRESSISNQARAVGPPQSASSSLPEISSTVTSTQCKLDTSLFGIGMMGSTDRCTGLFCFEPDPIVVPLIVNSNNSIGL